MAANIGPRLLLFTAVFRSVPYLKKELKNLPRHAMLEVILHARVITQREKRSILCNIDYHEEAEQIAQQIGLTDDFKVLDWWIDKFKKRIPLNLLIFDTCHTENHTNVKRKGIYNERRED